VPHFFFFAPHPRFYRAFLFCDFTEYCPRGEKKFALISYVCFSGVHFNAFGVPEHVMNAVTVCIAETWSLSCVLLTFFCTMSQNFYWSKKWYKLFTIFNVFCMQAGHFRNFQIRASLCSPCHYIFRAYTTKKLRCVMSQKIAHLTS